MPPARAPVRRARPRRSGTTRGAADRAARRRRDRSARAPGPLAGRGGIEAERAADVDERQRPCLVGHREPAYRRRRRGAARADRRRWHARGARATASSSTASIRRSSGRRGGARRKQRLGRVGEVGTVFASGPSAAPIDPHSTPHGTCASLLQKKIYDHWVVCLRRSGKRGPQELLHELRVRLARRCSSSPARRRSR